MGVWLALVAIGSFLPGRWKFFFHTVGRLHLPLHFAVFASSGLVVFGFVASPARRVVACALLIGFAFTVEALQRLVYPIHFEWHDFATDTCGILTALLLTGILRSRGRRLV